MTDARDNFDCSCPESPERPWDRSVSHVPRVVSISTALQTSVHQIPLKSLDNHTRIMYIIGEKWRQRVFLVKCQCHEPDSGAVGS